MSFTNEQIERYSRHIILKEIGVKGQKKLLSSKVLIIGAGGLGAPAAMYLAAAGVGTIGIAETRLPQRASTKQFLKPLISVIFPTTHRAAHIAICSAATDR